MAQDSSLLYTFILEAIIFVVILAIFLVIRKQFPPVFNPRQTQLPNHDQEYDFLLYRILSLPQNALVEITGVDGYFLLLFIKLILWMFVGFGLYGLIVLIPINASGGQDLDGLDMISMSNVEKGSSYIWAHLVSAYVYTFVAFYLIVKFTRQAQQIRIEHMKNSDLETYTAMVQGIPSEMRTDQNVLAFFDAIYPGKIESAKIVQHIPELPDLIRKRVELIEKLDEAISESNRKNEPAMVKLGFLGLFGESVDAVSYYQEQISTIGLRISSLREANSFQPASSGSAFVTFQDARSRIVSCQSIHHADPFSWMVSSAPNSTDVYWENMNIPQNHKHARTVVGETVTFFFVVFYAIPISFIIALSNADSLSEKADFLKEIVKYKLLRAFIEGLLPTILLIAFDIFTPIFLRFLSKFQGAFTYTELETGLLKKFYSLQIFNVFFVSTIAGSIFDSLSDIVDSPTSIIDSLGESLPKISNFFMVYILFQAFVSLPMSLLRIGPLLQYYFIQKYSNKTEKQKQNAVSPTLNSLGMVYPQLLLILLISLTYSTIAPIVIPIAFFFFVVSYIVEGYKVIFLTVDRCDTKGEYWPIATRRMVFALLVYQATLTGYFSIKLAVEQTPLMFPLLVMTFLFYFYMERVFYQNWHHLPLNEAVHMIALRSYNHDLYSHPALNESQEHQLCDDFKYAKILISELPSIVSVPDHIMPFAITPSERFVTEGFNSQTNDGYVMSEQ